MGRGRERRVARISPTILASTAGGVIAWMPEEDQLLGNTAHEHSLDMMIHLRCFQISKKRCQIGNWICRCRAEKWIWAENIKLYLHMAVDEYMGVDSQLPKAPPVTMDVQTQRTCVTLLIILSPWSSESIQASCLHLSSYTNTITFFVCQRWKGLGRFVWHHLGRKTTVRRGQSLGQSFEKLPHSVTS